MFCQTFISFFSQYLLILLLIIFTLCEFNGLTIMTIFNDLFEVTNEFFANEMWTKISEMPVIVWKYFSQFPNK